MKNIFLLTIMLLYLTVGSAQKNFIDQNYISVTGKAEMEIVPDEIYIHITINENDRNGKISVETLEIKMINGLQSIGIDIKKDLKVTSFSSGYEKFFFKKNDVLKSKSYELCVTDSKKVQAVFLLLEDIEISNAYIIKTDHSKIEEFRQQVKINAIKAAKTKAELLSKSIDQSIGKALFIEEETHHNSFANQSNFLEEVIVTGYGNSSKTQQITLPDIEPIQLNSTVKVNFALN